MEAKGTTQPDLAARPGGKSGSDPVMELRGGANFPGQQGDARKKERNKAEEKPFPRELARLHADPIHPSDVARDEATLIRPPRPRVFLTRLAPYGEPNSRIFLSYQEIRNANSGGASDAGGGPAETVRRLPAMIPWSSSTGARLTATMESADNPASS